MWPARALLARGATKLRAERLAMVALLVGCNGILGIGSDYHLVSSTSGGAGGTDGGTTSGGSAGTASGRGGSRSGAGGTDGGASGSSVGSGGRGGTSSMVGGEGGDSGASGEAGLTGDGGTGGGSGGNGGSSATGGSNGGTTGGAGLGGAAGSAGSPTGITVDLTATGQMIEGFGIGDLWQSAMTSVDATALYDATTGIGLSMLRIAMGTDGGPQTSGTFTDVDLAHGFGARVIATVMSAGANCKSNNNVNDGGHLTPGCYDSWASTIAAFVGVVKTETNVDLYAVSAQSEPDFASCGTANGCDGHYTTMLYSTSEMTSFVKVLQPKLAAANPMVKLVSPETRDWRRLWTDDSASGSPNALNGNYDYGHVLHADSDAWNAIDVLGTHQYESQSAMPWPSAVSPAIPIWVTEVSGSIGWPQAEPSSDMINGIAVAGWIHDALVNGASAWFWRQYQAPPSDHNEGLRSLQDGLTKRYYTLGNYSRFIRWGFNRVDVTGPIPAEVLLSAYRGSDGTTVIVAINRALSSPTLTISIAGGTSPASFVPWVTSDTDDLAEQAAVSVSSGSLDVTLDPHSVTTFVGAP